MGSGDQGDGEGQKKPCVGSQAVLGGGSVLSCPGNQPPVTRGPKSVPGCVLGPQVPLHGCGENAAREDVQCHSVPW